MGEDRIDLSVPQGILHRNGAGTVRWASPSETRCSAESEEATVPGPAEEPEASLLLAGGYNPCVLMSRWTGVGAFRALQGQGLGLAASRI